MQKSINDAKFENTCLHNLLSKQSKALKSRNEFNNLIKSKGVNNLIITTSKEAYNLYLIRGIFTLDQFFAVIYQDFSASMDDSFTLISKDFFYNKKQYNNLISLFSQLPNKLDERERKNHLEKNSNNHYAKLISFSE